jgi:tetratricopeptide (TPR) repeat protein
MNNNGTYPLEWDEWDVGAYMVLRDQVSFEAADASTSLIPGLSGFQYRLQSSMLLAEVQNYPQKKVNDAYALDILNHKPTVEVSYSVHFMGNQNAMSLLQDPAGRFFLHYIIMPERLSLETFQDKRLVDLRTTLRLANPGGKTVYQQERYIPLELSQEEMKAVEKSSFHLYDAVPLVPGMYMVSLLLENTVSKEFTTVEKTVSVPEGNLLWMSPLVLARQIGRDTSAGGASRSFQVGRIQIYPALNNTFRKQDRLFVFLQIYALSQTLKDGGVLGYYLFKDDEAVYSYRKKVSEYEGGRDFLEELPADKLLPGTYAAKVVLWDQAGREVLSQEASFLVAEKTFPGTWVVAQANPPEGDPYYSYVFGTQYLNTGKIDEAREELAQAYEKKPDSLDYAVGYARALQLTKEPGKARSILLPFEAKGAANFDLYEILGKTCRDTGDFDKAIEWFQKALPLKGNLLDILNPLGECYLNKGDKEGALKAWTRSLQIDPNQADIKKLIEKIR